MDIALETPAAFRTSYADDLAEEAGTTEAAPVATGAPETPTEPRRKAPLVLVALVVLGGGAFAASRVLAAGAEATDDAQIEGHVVQVAARIQGTVDRVLVQDHARVHAGDVIVALDPTDFDTRLEAARAELAAAEAQRESARAALAITETSARAGLVSARGTLAQAASTSASQGDLVDQADADIAAAFARETLARRDLERIETLARSGATTEAELDARRTAVTAAEAATAAARARREGSVDARRASFAAIAAARGRVLASDTVEAQIEAARAALALADANVARARAALHTAEVNRERVEVRAPIDGIVERRSVEVGQNVGPERTLLAIVPTDGLWIVANYKEDQLADMREGQEAEVRIDSYGRRDFVGHVESIGAASGSRFALIPPDNASGNFVKVTQRVPVIIRLDGVSRSVALRPGLSAEVTVRTATH